MLVRYTQLNTTFLGISELLYFQLSSTLLTVGIGHIDCWRRAY